MHLAVCTRVGYWIACDEFSQVPTITSTSIVHSFSEIESGLVEAA